jgi:hypothetical protein
MQANDTTKAGLCFWQPYELISVLLELLRNADLRLQEVAYNFTLTFRNMSSFPTLQPPQIWFAHIPDDSSSSRELQAVTPWLVPSWQLIPGLHLEAGTTMTKRKFIASTFLRDIIGGAKLVCCSTAL